MSNVAVSDLLLKTSEVYYYGDHVTGDLLLTKCVQLVTNFSRSTEKNEVSLKALRQLRSARAIQDFTAMADILRYELLPCLVEKNH
jgi:hypothetical protein